MHWDWHQYLELQLRLLALLYPLMATLPEVLVCLGPMVAACSCNPMRWVSILQSRLRVKHQCMRGLADDRLWQVCLQRLLQRWLRLRLQLQLQLQLWLRLR